MVTLRKRNEFSSDSIIDDLNTLIKFKKGQKQNAQSLPEVNLNLAMSATSALIKYLDVNVIIVLFRRDFYLYVEYHIFITSNFDDIFINKFDDFLFLRKTRFNRKRKGERERESIYNKNILFSSYLI